MPNETMSRSSQRTRSTEAEEVGYVAEEDWDEIGTEAECVPPPPEPAASRTPSRAPSKAPSRAPSKAPSSKARPDEKAEVGESSANSPKKLECLYDSGCQISSSSLEMVTPELLRAMQLSKIANTR